MSHIYNKSMSDNLHKDSFSSDLFYRNGEEKHERSKDIDFYDNLDLEPSNSINSVSGSDGESDLRETQIRMIKTPLQSDVAERETIIKKLMHNIFVCKKKPKTVKEFVIKNKDLLSKLHPKLQERLSFNLENLYELMDDVDDDVAVYVLDHLDKSCEDFSRDAADLEIPNNLRIIVDEIIPKIEGGIKSENVVRIFGKFLGHYLWILDFREEYDAARKKKAKKKTLKYLSSLFHRTAEYFKSYEEIWLRVAEFQYKNVKDAAAAIDTLKKGLKHHPDSVMLSLSLACVESKSYMENSESETEIIARKFQKFIDRALIAYSDNGFEIKAFEWIEHIDETMRKFGFRIIFFDKFISALIQSIVGLGDEKELEKFLKQTSHPEKFYLIHKVQAYPKNKHVWIQAIFHEWTGYDDCELLMKTACEHFLSEVNLRNLIYAKCKWINNEFGAAERLFKIVIADAGWNREIVEIYEEFQKYLKKDRAERHELYQQIIIDIDPSDEEAVYHVIGQEDKKDDIQRGLKDDLAFGEYKIVHKVLTKLLLVEPKDSESYFIKAQAEMKLGKLNYAAENFEAGNFLLEWAQLEEKRGNLSKAREILEHARAKSSNEDFEEDTEKKVRAWIASICFVLRANEKDEAQTLLAQAMKIWPESGKLWAQAIFMEDGTDGISREFKYLEACERLRLDYKYILLSAAKLKLIDGNADEARYKFNEAVDKYPSFGDAWIYFYKLERLWGSEESSREVLIRFIKETLEYNMKGELWDASQGDIDNWGLTDEELLVLTANRIDFYSI